MTVDNKNKKGPVTEADDEPTSEMESLNATVTRADPRSDTFGEIESDEDTFDFDRLDSISDATSESVAALQSDIKLRNERINRLQFDIEQFRARWTGLEKEIKVREEMTDHLNAELAATKQKLSRTESLLSSRDRDIDALQKKLFDQTGRLESFEEEARHVSQTVQAGRSVIEELQDTVTRQQGQLRKLSREHDAALHAREYAEKRAQTLEDSNAELQAQAEQQASQLLEAAEENETLRRELAQRNEDEASATDNATTSHGGRAAIEAAPPELRAVLSDNALVIDQLKQQIARTEQYADSLRIRLIDAADAAERDQQNRIRLEHAVSDARESLAALREDLETERLRNAELLREAEQGSEKFAQELRQMRFELGDAQATLADQETVNERLASDLMDHQGYREALEQQLAKVQKDRDRAVTRLERRTRQLEQVNDELERKLENKENAIAALLGELASRSRTIESLGEIESVIHEIDGRMSDRIDDKADADKDRLARLLIGNVGGQELQFPLFKPRLTIGRTANNDIQLRAQFISRRHALIITENESTRIVDWGSKNGVYVNDSRVAEQVLKNGDIVAIGTAEFRYEERIKR